MSKQNPQETAMDALICKAKTQESMKVLTIGNFCKRTYMNWWRMENLQMLLWRRFKKVLLQAQYCNVHKVQMSRNFGHSQSVPLTENRKRGRPKENKGWWSHV